MSSFTPLHSRLNLIPAFQIPFISWPSPLCLIQVLFQVPHELIKCCHTLPHRGSLIFPSILFIALFFFFKFRFLLLSLLNPPQLLILIFLVWWQLIQDPSLGQTHPEIPWFCWNQWNKSGICAGVNEIKTSLMWSRDLFYPHQKADLAVQCIFF